MAHDKGNRRWSKADEAPNVLEHYNDPLREIWQWRWKKLPRFHKIGMLICLGFALLIIWTFLGIPLLSARGWSELGKVVSVFGAVALLLALFFGTLTRNIHKT
jgi:hypothetical protein